MLSTQQTVTIEATPTIQLAGTTAYCGKSYTLTFDNTVGSKTRTIFTGTPTTGANTYTWSVTGGSWNFETGYDLHSKNPKIYFDNFATYTVTVTHTNSCGTETASQVITFSPAPTVTVGPTQVVCQSAGVVHLNGVVGGTYASTKWLKDSPATGTFADDTSPVTDYTPSAADWARGYVTLVLHAYNTNLGSCNDEFNGVVVTLIRTTTGTSATTKTICSGSNVNYTITTNNDTYTPAPTFAWTAAVTSGTVTGLTAGTGTASTIQDVLVNTNPTVTAKVTYTITPSTNGCAGTPFDLVVTIPAVPVVTPVAAALAICTNNAAGITMTSSLTGTRYTWTVSAPAGITGAAAQTTLTTIAAITNTLRNTTSGTLTVTYTITPYNTDGCPGAAVPISVDVYGAPTVSNAGPTQNLCGVTSTTLAANLPGTGETGKWTVVTGTGLTFLDDTDPHTTLSGLVDGDSYTVKWTITTGNTCSSSSNVNISVTAASVGGITAGATTICSGSNGSITLSGYVGNIVRWQRSIDAGANWINITNTTTTLNYTNLTQTTQYRAEVQSGTCASQFSSISIVTVNAPTPQAAIVGADQQLCNAGSATLTAQANLGYTGKWTQTAGPTTGVSITDDTNPTTTVTGLTGGVSSNVYTFTWTVNGLAPCGNTSAAVNVTNYAASAGGITATTDATTVCSGSNAGTINLTGKLGAILNWEKSTDGGTTWQTIAVTSTSVSFSNLTQTTQYRAVVQNGGCTSANSTIITITVNQPTPTAIAGINQVLCNVTTTVLDATAPGGAFVGQWSQTGGPTGAVFSNANDPKATVTGLIGDNIYTFTWTILANAPCTNTSQSITVNVSAATVAGNTNGGTTVCAGDNSGQVTLTGHHGSILYWEKSEDTGATWTTINNTTATISYLNITQTTQYRAYVKNGSCNLLISPLTVIRVNQPAPPANAGPNQILCNQPLVTLTANNPGAFVGTWTQVSGPAVNITNPNNYQTTVTGLTGANNYVFRWTITALAPCVDTRADVTITNNPDIVASFTSTAKVGCGDLTVRFTNTSNNQPLANFIWNFGDGQTSSLASPQHTFAQRTDGRDTTYYISLGIIGNCIDRPAIVDSILVRPATPVARILPVSTNGCGNFALEVRNTSPGNNVSYDFYLYDGTTLVQKITKTDKSSVIFDPITTVARKVFTLYMTATGYCSNTNTTTHIPIAISPSSVVAQMVIQNGINSGCAPLKTTFFNNSFGGDNFYYTIYDANNNVVDKPIGGLTSLPYTFNRAGTYYVTITAISSCGLNESTRTRIDVYATPTPNFVANITSACKDGLITFTNNTLSNDPNTTATSLIYDWDFGDGSPHSALYAPSHGYHFRSTPYTVTLRATNTTSGCTDVFVRTAYINIYGPPKTAFTIKPDSVTSIPNYSFSFIDQTPADAASWKWTFGDGQTSTRRNPTVTYADTGTYKVTLTTATANGCDSTITRTVRIGGVPGQLFLPNAFMPESATTELKMFMAKGSGIKTWQLQIFNNYGQLVWQTTKLSPKGEPEEGWDGTFKGVPAPQGVYQWQASASFINGTEWKGNSYKDELPKRVGSVHLIR